MHRPISFFSWFRILFCLVPGGAFGSPIFFGAVSTAGNSDQFFFYEKDEVGTEISLVTHRRKAKFGETKRYAGTIIGNFDPVAIFRAEAAETTPARLGMIAHDKNKMPYLFLVSLPLSPDPTKISKIDFSQATPKLIEGFHPSSDTVILGAAQLPHQKNTVTLFTARTSTRAPALEIKNLILNSNGDVAFDLPTRPGPRLSDAVPLVLFGDPKGGLRALIAPTQKPSELELGRFIFSQGEFLYQKESQLSFPGNAELATGLRNRHRKVCAALIAS